MAVFHLDNPQIRIKFTPPRQNIRHRGFAGGIGQFLNEAPVALIVESWARGWPEEMKISIQPILSGDENERKVGFSTVAKLIVGRVTPGSPADG